MDVVQVWSGPLSTRQCWIRAKNPTFIVEKRAKKSPKVAKKVKNGHFWTKSSSDHYMYVYGCGQSVVWTPKVSDNVGSGPKAPLS